MKKMLCVIGMLFIVFLFAIMLSGCSRKTPVENAFNDVQTSIVEVKNTLPPECRTALVLEKIEKLETKREVAEQVCQSRIKDVESKYERTLFILGIVILAFLAKIFIKK